MQLASRKRWRSRSVFNSQLLNFKDGWMFNRVRAVMLTSAPKMLHQEHLMKILSPHHSLNVQNVPTLPHEQLALFPQGKVRQVSPKQSNRWLLRSFPDQFSWQKDLQQVLRHNNAAKEVLALMRGETVSQRAMIGSRLTHMYLWNWIQQVLHQKSWTIILDQEECIDLEMGFNILVKS